MRLTSGVWEETRSGNCDSYFCLLAYFSSRNHENFLTNETWHQDPPSDFIRVLSPFWCPPGIEVRTRCFMRFFIG